MEEKKHLTKLTDDQVRETVDRLKQIEIKAEAVLETVTKERASFNRRVYAEIEKRKIKINEETKREITGLYEKTDKQIAAKAVQIQLECENKKQQIKETFSANREAWHKKIFENVLAGI